MPADRRPGPDAVLFDMDGTLVDSEKLWTVSLHDTARWLGGTLSSAARDAVVGGDLPRTLATIFDDLGLPPHDGERMAAAARFLTDRTAELFAGGLPWRPGAQDALRLLDGLGVQLTEALAEYWHRRVREELRFPEGAAVAAEDPDDVREFFDLGYRGARYSLGYGACPNLEDRTKIVELLQPDRIGVALSDELQLHPEQSTDALVAHHPEAKYFNAG